MKTLKLVVLGMVLFFAGAAQAQVSVHFNLGVQPDWAPVGYSDVQYYYLPDVEAYYDVNSSMFVYYEGRSWVRRSYLPSRYRNYDLYNGYKVAMKDYHGKTPYYSHSDFRTKYPKGYRGQPQRTIGNRPGNGNVRENNQVNRGRGGIINKNDKQGDRNYDKRGNEVKQKNDRGKSNDKKNSDRGNGNDKRNK